MSKITDPELLKQLNDPQGHGLNPKPIEQEMRMGDPIDFVQGGFQGVLDPIEGLIQLAEKATGWQAPGTEGLRNWARNYRKKVQQSYAGRAGQIAGNIAAPLLIPGGAVGSLAGRAISGAALGAAQPVSGGGDYWRTKGNQAILGGAGGAALPALAGQAAKAYRPVSEFIEKLPKWAQPFGHVIGAPALPLSAVAQRAANMPGGAYGRVIGEIQGSLPSGDPSGITIRPITDQPAPPPQPEPEEEPTPPPARSGRGEPLRMRRSEE